MKSYRIVGWSETTQQDTIVPMVQAITEDYLEHCFEEEKDWDHVWEYLQVILPELGLGNYLVEPLLKEVYDYAGRQKKLYQVGQKDALQVASLRKLKLPEQRTPEWFAFRQGRLTASELSYCVSQSLTSAISQKIILQKIHPESVPYISSAATSHGTLYEPIAQMLYEKQCRTRLFEFGCIPHETVSWLAASPDGITEDGVMVEIKCPYSRKPKGIPSMNYYTQIQAQLEVCQLELCDFMECEIEMYESRKAYIEDTAPKNEETDTLRRKHHLYKGMRREFLPKRNSGILKGASIVIERNGPSVSECMDIQSMTHSSTKDWISAQLNQCSDSIGYSVQYWVVRRIWITRIPKNTEWFHSILPKARQFWEEVLKKKEEGMKPPPVQTNMCFVEETI